MLVQWYDNTDSDGNDDYDDAGNSDDDMTLIIAMIMIRKMILTMLVTGMVIWH